MKNQFKNKKTINIDPQSFNVASNEFTSILKTSNAEDVEDEQGNIVSFNTLESVQRLLKDYGFDLGNIEIDESFWQSTPYIKGAEFGSEKLYIDSKEDMMKVAKILYNKDPKTFKRQFERNQNIEDGVEVESDQGTGESGVNWN